MVAFFEFLMKLIEMLSGLEWFVQVWVKGGVS
jgi:hypothetical protein